MNWLALLLSVKHCKTWPFISGVVPLKLETVDDGVAWGGFPPSRFFHFFFPPPFPDPPVPPPPPAAALLAAGEVGIDMLEQSFDVGMKAMGSKTRVRLQVYPEWSDFRHGTGLVPCSSSSGPPRGLRTTVVTRTRSPTAIGRAATVSFSDRSNTARRSINSDLRIRSLSSSWVILSTSLVMQENASESKLRKKVLLSIG